MLKRTILIVAIVLLLPVMALAQGSIVHKNTLNWVASPDAASNSSVYYNVLRALGPCPAAGSPTTLSFVASVLPGVLSYVDSNVLAGQSYCYVVRSAVKTAGVEFEGADSNTAGGTTPLAGASGLTLTRQ
jgi:hypothetical protein